MGYRTSCTSGHVEPPSTQEKASAEEGSRQDTMAATGGRSWADLHPSLLLPILAGLPLPDYIRFGAVCPSWLEAESSRMVAPSPRQLPWILLPPSSCDVRDRSRSFCSLSDGRIHRTVVAPAYRGSRCLGSSQGWLLLADRRRPPRVEMLLVNPITRARIDLGRWPHLRLPERMVLSSSPTDPDCELLLLSGESRSAHCCTMKDSKVTRIEGASWSTEAVACDGGLYMITEKYGLCAVQLTPSGDRRLWSMGLDESRLPESKWWGCICCRKPDRRGPRWWDSCCHRYLVEAAGEILLAMVSETGVILVYKADIGKKAWVEVKDLGDRALFLGPGCSLSAPVASSSERNRVYVINTKAYEVPLVPWAVYKMREASTFRYTACVPPPQEGVTPDDGDNVMWLMPSLK